jgi:hypothetical protein
VPRAFCIDRRAGELGSGLGPPARSERYCTPFQEEPTMVKKVEFDAHKKIKKPVEVQFETRKGKKVDFVAEKKVEVPVHVKFKAKDRKK